MGFVFFGVRVVGLVGFFGVDFRLFVYFWVFYCVFMCYFFYMFGFEGVSLSVFEINEIYVG